MLKIPLGILRVSENIGEISLEAFWEWRSDGKLYRSLLSDVTIRVTPCTEKRVTSEQFYQILAACEQAPGLAEALSEMAGEITWFSIYRSLEALEEDAGGEKALKKKCHIAPAQYQRLKRTANSYRHAQLKFRPPANPITIGEAQALLNRLIKGALCERKIKFGTESV